MGRSGYDDDPEDGWDDYDEGGGGGGIGVVVNTNAVSDVQACDNVHSEFSTVLRNRLSQDLRNVDLGRFEDILAARIEDFAVRSGNEDRSGVHLSKVVDTYRRARYDSRALLLVEVRSTLVSGIDASHPLRTIAAEICRNQSNMPMGDSDANSRRTSSESRRRSTEVEEQGVEYPQVFQDFPPDRNAHGLLDRKLVLEEEGLRSSEAYRWLISMVQRSAHLDGIKPSCMDNHRRKMTWGVETSRAHEIWPEKRSLMMIPAYNPPPLYEVRFELSWDLLKFLREEYDGEKPAEVVGQVITLTGDGHSVQAQSCRGYLEQVWPTTGSSFMDMIEELVKNTGSLGERLLPDGTLVSAHLSDDVCIFEAWGTKPGLGDVAEQLLWISTALRTPESLTEGMALCSAELVETTAFPSHLPFHQPRPHEALGYRVIHSTYHLTGETLQSDGSCWPDLFRFCPIVSGYPIPSRNPNRPGLEIPLEMIASLICAERVTSFGHDFIIKGYSDLLYATEHHSEYLVWHLICNKSTPGSGVSRISFSDDRIPRSTEQKLPNLRVENVLSLRHIVGWAPTVRSNAGAPDVEYSTIASSDLAAPQQGWAIDKFQITAGKYVTASVGFVRGKKDKPIHRIQEDYVYRLLYIQKTKFVLFDVDTRKAWLVNGLSTLLHLVRSHLTHAENDTLHQSILLIKASELKARGGRSGVRAAFETLTCESNRALRLHRKGGRRQTGIAEQANEEYYSLENLVKDLLHCLEQILDHQSGFRSERASIGYPIKTSLGAQLEGYDFMDVATRRLLLPRGTRLFHDGKGWTPLTRTLDAPTLFGKHFGELLELDGVDLDRTRCATCHWNHAMPPRRDLLAVQVEDIREAASREDRGILHFADDLRLDIHSRLFESCRRDEPVPTCKKRERVGRVQRASEIVPRLPCSDAVAIDSTFSTEIETTGAILLGMPRQPGDNGSKERRGLLESFFRHPLQSRPFTDSPQIRVSSSPSKDTIGSISASNSKISCSRTETVPLTGTHPANSMLLPNCTEELTGSSSGSSQPSIDDYHRRKRALRRQGLEEGLGQQKIP